MRLMYRGVVLFWTVLFFLPHPLSTSREPDVYLIGRDDLLDVTVWQAPDLTKPVTVGFDGMVDFPYVGRIPAAGKTTREFAQLIREKLAQGYVKNPQVSVVVKEYNSKKILVFGQVGKPGLYKLKRALPLLELLFMVDGVTQDAKRMTVIRRSSSDQEAIPAGLIPDEYDEAEQDEGEVLEVDLVSLLLKGDLSQNIMIRPGDTLYVASGTGQRFYVLGQVQNPGPYEWVEEITVLEAIKLAGGAAEMAALNRIKVKKTVRGHKKEVKVNVVDIMKGKKKDDVVVLSGDMIIVPRSWI